MRRLPYGVMCLSLLLLSGCWGGHVGNSKVTFCHHPPGNPSNAHTLTVKINALRGVVNEELDYEGPCRTLATPTPSATPPALVEATPDPLACKQGLPCGEFNYTYGVADSPDLNMGAQRFEISTTFENIVNGKRKQGDAGNDDLRYEIGQSIESVNTEYSEKNALPSGTNIYHGEETKAVILD